MNQHTLRYYLDIIMKCPNYYPNLYQLPLSILVPELTRLHQQYQDSPLSYLESYYQFCNDLDLARAI